MQASRVWLLCWVAFGKCRIVVVGSMGLLDRNDAELNFLWISGSPSAGINSGTHCHAVQPTVNSSFACCTHITGTRPLDSARHVLDNSRCVPRFMHHADLRVDDEQNCLVTFAHGCHCDYLRIDE